MARSPKPPPQALRLSTYAELEAIVHRRAEEHRRRSTALREARHGAAPAGEQAQYVTVASVRNRPREC